MFIGYLAFKTLLQAGCEAIGEVLQSDSEYGRFFQHSSVNVSSSSSASDYKRVFSLVTNVNLLDSHLLLQCHLVRESKTIMCCHVNCLILTLYNSFSFLRKVPVYFIYNTHFYKPQIYTVFVHIAFTDLIDFRFI